MADVELFGGGDFGEGAVGGGIEEEGVVAEALTAAGGIDDAAFDGAVKGADELAVLGERP